ncbi:hypothetical protein Cgig2_013079 [Carnegiea gigantea]|uniref:PHD-type zinc finger plants domain-containing protein n=1 Tax=Carnegiea gigantea TaxID=171969 RepID=A0A9Q1KRD4_9CARY|nr:hypothetical protein Cgig2_013079 [Carnegiea gigantea]
MVDQIQERVCCLCGDVGFPDRLFHCSRCRFRFQHSYCSNYYCGSMELSSPSSSLMCDWCQSEVAGNRNGMISSGGSNNCRSKASSTMSVHQYNNNNNNNNYVGTIRSEYTSGERIKNHHQDDHRTIVRVPSSSNNGSKNTGVPSPRPNSHRRYKLLKDVMC